MSSYIRLPQGGLSVALQCSTYVCCADGNKKLTVEELGALGITLLHLLTLVRGRLQVTVSGGEHGSPGLNQELAHLHVVTGRCTVQGGPDRGAGKKDERSVKRDTKDWTRSARVSCKGSFFFFLYSPSIAISCIHIDTKLHQELDNLGVAGTNSVMQSCDALIIGQAGVLYL